MLREAVRVKSMIQTDFEETKFLNQRCAYIYDKIAKKSYLGIYSGETLTIFYILEDGKDSIALSEGFITANKDVVL